MWFGSHITLRARSVSSSSTCLADLRTLKSWLRKVRPDGVITSSGNLAELLERAECKVPRDLGVAATSLLDGHFSAGVDQGPALHQLVAERSFVKRTWTAWMRPRGKRSLRPPDISTGRDRGG